MKRVKRSLGRGKEESARHRRARRAGSRVDGTKRCGGLKEPSSFKELQVALSGCSGGGEDWIRKSIGGVDWT